MKTIHKIAAIVIRDDKFLMVRKRGKDIWTNLGGKLEPGETEEEALVREIREEFDCASTIIRKLGDFEEEKAVFDDARLKLSCYLVELNGGIRLNDDELEEYGWIDRDWRSKGIKLPDSVVNQVLPHCISAGLLRW